MFAVNWPAEVLDQFAAILLKANPADADQTEAAALALNVRLAADPLSEGESRAGPFRVTFPRTFLTAYVRVSEARRAVEVRHVHRRA